MGNRDNDVTAWKDVLESNPAGEIMLSPRTRIGSRVGALSGLAVVDTEGTVIATIENTTVSSFFSNN
jgi:hypothetical protein